MARARFEPDEFLDFLSGRLANSYINDDADVDRRLAGLNLQLDPDGRYRVNEFFCRITTWKQTVRRLMAQSDLVAMDLRAFTAQMLTRGSKGKLLLLAGVVHFNPVPIWVAEIDLLDPIRPKSNAARCALQVFVGDARLC